MRRLVALLLALGLLAPTASGPSAILAGGEQTVPVGVQRIGARDCAPIEVGDGYCEPLDLSPINLAVVDTGIDLDNPDLNVVGGVDCVQAAPNALPFAFADATLAPQVFDEPRWAEVANPEATGYDDAHGHGTHVSGIAGAIDNGFGVVGVAPNVSLWSVRVLDGRGGGSIAQIICGLEWIHANRDLIDVVNMSLGADVGEKVLEVAEGCNEVYDPPAPVYLPQPEKKLKDPLHEAICQLYDDGIPVVVAAGNGPGDAAHGIPAAYDEVFAVSSFVETDGERGGLGGRVDTDVCPFGGHDDMFLAHHNFTPDQRIQSYAGKAVDFTAPGVCVLSTVPGGYASFTGTSMASPHVAGVVARLIYDLTRDPLMLPNGQVFEHDALAAYRVTRNAETVEMLRETLITHAEKQGEDFRDVDQWREPIIRRVSLIGGGD